MTPRRPTSSRSRCSRTTAPPRPTGRRRTTPTSWVELPLDDAVAVALGDDEIVDADEIDDIDDADADDEIDDDEDDEIDDDDADDDDDDDEDDEDDIVDIEPDEVLA